MARLPKPAQYLLRIDDLCSGVHARRWERLRLLIEEFNIRPILAVVPENQDRTLEASTPDPKFWHWMRTLQAAGATVAVHGYRHLCSSNGRSFPGLHAETEFAGVALDVQRDRITRGLEILRGHGLDPKLWVAPKHTFDWNTLRALRESGLPYLSDGLARVPFRRGGVTWIPMQFWAPVAKTEGLWTICMHPNTTLRTNFEQLRNFLRRFAHQFTSFDRVVAEFNGSQLSAWERAYEITATARLWLHRAISAQRQRC